MATSNGGLPKTIWFLWFQGLDNAPRLVRKCHESWVAANPGWRVVFLDERSLRSVTSRDYSTGYIGKLPPQARSDLIRLDLLSHHGGIWADATCFCVQPVDDWLPPNLDSGFFAFSRPRPSQIISSWFLAAEPGNVLVSRMSERLLAYWGDHAFRNNHRRFLIKVLTRLLRRSPGTRNWWFSAPIRDWLGIYPYYAIMYMFEKLVSEDPECARVWADTPRVSAGPPHRLRRAGLLSPATAELRAEIDRQQVPVYKTAWNLRGREVRDDSVLGYLLAGDGYRYAKSPISASRRDQGSDPELPQPGHDES
ncbi:MAG TPA: capsular polysaccharide synthesis protein [Streptosporangiaceae bacterium]